MDFNPNCPSKLQAAAFNGTTLACNVDAPDYSWYQQGCPGVFVSYTQGSTSSNSSCPGSQTADYTITWCPFDTAIAQPPNSTSTTTTSTSAAYQSSTSPSQPTGTPGSKKHLRGGAIAGIAVGTIGGVTLILLFLWFLRRRRPSETPLPILDGSKEQDDQTYDPFASSPRSPTLSRNAGPTLTPFVYDPESTVELAGRKRGDHLPSNGADTDSNALRPSSGGEKAVGTPESDGGDASRSTPGIDESGQSSGALGGDPSPGPSPFEATRLPC